MSERGADLDALTALLRNWDRPRYYAALFAAPPIRADLFALYGFAAEIARIPDLVSEPTIGEIRLQFWHDQLKGLGEGRGEGGPPTLDVLAGVIDRHRLPIAPFLALIDTRRADLYSDPPASLGDLDGYFGETQSALFQLAAIIAGGKATDTAEVSGHAGVAYGVARRLARLAADRARGRTILPLDLLAAANLTAAKVFVGAPSAAIADVVARTNDHAVTHLHAAYRAFAGAPRSLDPVFLPLAAVMPLVRRVQRLGPAIAGSAATMSDLETLTRIAWARLRGLPGRIGQ